MHTISFDRHFVSMAAYEDLLVIVYHTGPPSWGTQVLDMKILRIEKTRAFHLGIASVPLVYESYLKWLGFSEEGMLFSHDTGENLRVYNFDNG